MLRITNTLATAGIFDKIIIAASYERGLREVEHLDECRTVFRVKTLLSPNLNSLIRYFYLVEWSLRIYWKFRKLDVAVVNPHSVPTLPIAVFFKKISGSKLVYDTHEIETEQYPNGSIVKGVSKFLERSFISYSDIIFTTSDGYSQWYEATYKINPVITVKNYSTSKKERLHRMGRLREKFGIGENEILFIYQGIIAKGRGVEMLINVFRRTPSDFHLVFMGYGPETELVIQESLVNPKIHYQTAVAPEKVYEFVQSCDVGFCIIENLHLSYYHTLPNKMLECLNVGVPVIVSNFPDMSSSVNEFDCGWPIGPDELSLSRLLTKIDKIEISKKRRNALKWAQINTWETQENILRKAYSDLLT